MNKATNHPFDTLYTTKYFSYLPLPKIPCKEVKKQRKTPTYPLKPFPMSTLTPISRKSLKRNLVCPKQLTNKMIMGALPMENDKGL